MKRLIKPSKLVARLNAIPTDAVAPRYYYVGADRKRHEHVLWVVESGPPAICAVNSLKRFARALRVLKPNETTNSCKVYMMSRKRFTRMSGTARIVKQA